MDVVIVIGAELSASSDVGEFFLYIDVDSLSESYPEMLLINCVSLWAQCRN